MAVKGLRSQVVSSLDLNDVSINAEETIEIRGRALKEGMLITSNECVPHCGSMND
ncbi:hypothetical protein K788_00010710 (plasmid) [Paraburkholderia caribensis MBA4]|uniref:Uncharacterized protein n=1 Tax=Paraburkholderia caribensis MBA4 TaxID=1323664 RepID=A0A0P0RQ49_9BURK|nr:hypothetical protein [Paraburkholderia caribensis]ALL71145.1 hypothetical protein K788_00010710 [Paraburkholderia caribensis MBA4]